MRYLSSLFRFYCHVDIVRGALAKRTRHDRVDVNPGAFGTRKSPSYLARRNATAGLQLAAVMMTRIRIIQRCTRGRFVESLFFISPRTGHGSSQVFEMLPAFLCISWACAFRAGDDASIFFSGPVEAEGGTSVAAPAGWLFWNLMAHPLLGEEDSTSPPRWL